MDRVKGIGNVDSAKNIQDEGGQNDTELLQQDGLDGEKHPATKMRLLSLTELIAEGTWRAMEWSGRVKENAVLLTLETVF